MPKSNAPKEKKSATIDLNKAAEFAERMSSSTTGQDSAEWLLASILVRLGSNTSRRHGVSIPQKSIMVSYGS